MKYPFRDKVYYEVRKIYRRDEVIYELLLNLVVGQGCDKLVAGIVSILKHIEGGEMS